MRHQRKDFRVDVDLPISCSFRNHDDQQDLLSSPGHILDISMGGMKISLPIADHAAAQQAGKLDYQIHLPEPFHSLNGEGEIRWTLKNPGKNYLQIGLAFSGMDQHHREELACIVEELSEC